MRHRMRHQMRPMRGSRALALRVLCKGRPVPKPARPEPMRLSRAESIDLTHTLQHCATWQQLRHVYDT